MGLAMRTATRPLILALVLALAPALAAAAPRLLHVSLYPYIPEAPAAALALKQGFERLHPDVRVEITFNPHYYETDPAAKGVLYEDADVHEIDVVFLGDFIARHRLAPLPAAFVASLDPMTPVAAEAATVGGKVVAVPQWLCGDFLIYRADETGLASDETFEAMEQGLRKDGLVMGLAGPDALGELYLSFLMARDGEPRAALADIGATPDPKIEGRIERLLALEPPGLGREPAYQQDESFYARQFARRTGGAFVGYSELIHDALDETARGCRIEDRCVTADEVRVAPFRLEDHRLRPMVWVDLFGIDARVHGRKLTDAEAFVRYAVSLPAYRALLVPEPGAIPRYLLPATETAFHDPAILAAGPLYPKFRAIIDQGVVVTAPRLQARLHDVAARLDADLPKTH
jgi:thiamine pyridinylase